MYATAASSPMFPETSRYSDEKLQCAIPFQSLGPSATWQAVANDLTTPWHAMGIVLLPFNHRHPSENPAECIWRRCRDSLRFWFLVLDSGPLPPPPPPPPPPLDGAPIKMETNEVGRNEVLRLIRSSQTRHGCPLVQSGTLLPSSGYASSCSELKAPAAKGTVEVSYESQAGAQAGDRTQEKA
ncbi:hypothetical protein ALC56_09568 [Trachymyrmex septentrionalis]|uniref:Uncharacterized protein n=1 Tax=Trachymyrmex septentrionalis TaxID=34720 RepID=A0A195F771_9HYME|nr:hypothetical protein ALC56_09568 [Trachymyrmex septentrionalis]